MDKIYNDFDFKIPELDGMQNIDRMKFLYDSILQFAKVKSKKALEIGCYKGCSTIFLSHACLKIGIDQIYAIDLFTGTPSWNQFVDTYEITKQKLSDYNLNKNVMLLRGNSY